MKRWKLVESKSFLETLREVRSEPGSWEPEPASLKWVPIFPTIVKQVMPENSKSKHQHTDKQELKRTTHTDKQELKRTIHTNNKKLKRTTDKHTDKLTKTDKKAKPHTDTLKIGKPRGPVGDKTKYFRPKGQPENGFQHGGR
jgi:hypothetical protein